MKYEMDLCRRRLLIDGEPALQVPTSFNPEDEIYEIHHIDDVQIAAIEEEPFSVEPSDLKKVTFKIDPMDRFKGLQRMTQSLGAYTAKVARENPDLLSPKDGDMLTSPETSPVKPEFAS